MEYLHQELTQRIIKCSYEVYKRLGYGFLEKVYERAMMIELELDGLIAQNQIPVKVFYRDTVVGDFNADILVENRIILEKKAAAMIVSENECQLINYLKSTEIEVGLLMNFGKKAEVRRKIFTNDRKNFLL